MSALQFYIDSANFSTATTVYLDSLLTDVAPDGYYSLQGYYRRQVDGALTDVASCPIIDTVSVTAVGETTATFNGNFINNGGDVNAVRGFVYGTSPNPTIANSVITDTVRAQGAYSLNVTGLTSEVTYYVRAYATVFGETLYGDQLSFITPCSNCVPGTEITIGTQIWTGCNLKVGTFRNGVSIPQVTDANTWATTNGPAWCHYDFNPANEAAYGRLYNVYAIISTANIAPTGYHVPTDAEWTTLTATLGGGTWLELFGPDSWYQPLIGTKLKEAGNCHWFISGGDNSSGFRAVGAGQAATAGYFAGLQDSTVFGTTSIAPGSSNRWSYHLSGLYDTIERKWVSLNQGISVRLIKD